ncbi:MAG TPA: DUF3467 domain-containing protein [Candidatus Methylomirabilis sp.]|nr:DUF3467 domain-containing protein [Candidatus Methylomirabilis sp.]
MTQQELPIPEEAVSDASAGCSQIRWDDPGIGAAYANAFTISATRDEIVFLFGMKQDRKANAGELTVQVSNRVALAPIVAERLLANLNSAIHAYEAEYGMLDSQPRPPAEPLRRTPVSPRHRAPVPDAEEKAGLLFRLVEDLKVGAGYERSVKMSEGSLLDNRCLLGLSKSKMGEGPDEKILDICTRLQMPREYVDALGEKLSEANYVHFGFEEGETTCLYKFYLEFWQRIEEDLKRNPDNHGPFLLHLGFKWDASDSSICAITRYTWHPWLEVEDLLARASRLLSPHDHGASFEIVKGIVGLASARIPHRDILYLEVAEDGNPRRSFDINTYRANLRLAELYPLWLQIGRQYSIPFQQMQALYERIQQKTFGHISGGTDRTGKDFLTVYYGVEGLHGSRHPSGLSMDGSPLATEASQMTACSRMPLPVGVESTDEKASRLFQLVQGLNVRAGLERSFKLVQNALLVDRFLMGFEQRAIGQGFPDRILDICRQLDMPDNFLETYRAQLPEASIVLFGFEKNGTDRVYKAYLEFGDRLGNVAGENADRSTPVLIHLGFKWDVSDNTRSRMTRYTCFPWLAVDDMLRTIWDAFYRQKDRRLIRLVEGIVNLAATRVGPNAFLYLEAAEDKNPRASFDINMYRANLRMEELYPFLLQAGQFFSIPSQRFHDEYESVGTQIFGHLRGGSDKDGKDFFTIYFGEKGSSR